MVRAHLKVGDRVTVYGSTLKGEDFGLKDVPIGTVGTIVEVGYLDTEDSLNDEYDVEFGGELYVSVFGEEVEKA